MSAPRIAVLDQGSSATKAAVVDGAGALAAETRIAVSSRHEGERVEQDPLEIWRSVESALDELRRSAGGFDVIALCTQRSSCLVWERSSGAPLTPLLSWQDRRHAGEAARLEPALGAMVRRATGLFLSPHYAALKLRGLLDETPGRRARAEAGELIAGTLDAWLLARLTGVASTEPGQAGRTLLYDLEGDRWSPELCAAFDVPVAGLPELRASAGARGSWRGVPVAALLGDQQAALLGHGGWRPGVVAAHVGTGAFVLASTGREIRRHPGLLSAVLASRSEERRFQLEGTVQSAGAAVDWACAVTGVRLAELTAQPLEPESLVRVVPAFVGLGAPWWRPRARAWIAGLDAGATGESLVRATLLGVAQRLADNVEALREAGVVVETLRSSGGLFQRADFAQAVSELAGSAVEVSAEERGLRGLWRWAAALAAEDDGPLTATEPPRARYLPRWPAARRVAARAAWLAEIARFVS